MIPKIIHYCWFGGKPLPPEVRRCIRSWQRVCPDYEIRRWDETNFDVTAHPFMKAAYEAGAWAFVSDIARLMVVHAHGGIYLDTDVELLRRPDGLLDNGCYVGTQQADGQIATGLGFGAEARDPAVGVQRDGARAGLCPPAFGGETRRLEREAVAFHRQGRSGARARPGHAPRRRLHPRRLHQAPGRRLLHVEPGDALQHAHRPAGDAGRWRS